MLDSTLPQTPSQTPQEPQADGQKTNMLLKSVYGTQNKPKMDPVITSTRVSGATSEMSKNSQKRAGMNPKAKKILLGVLVFFLFFGLITAGVAAYTLSVVNQMKAQAADVKATAKTAYDHFKEQNLPAAGESLKQTQEKMKAVRVTYSKLGFYNAIPIAHAYYQDGIHGLNAADAGLSAALKSFDAVTPYADVLGFKGQGTFAGGTTEDRLKVILQTLQKITPDLDKIAVDLETMKNEFAMIDEKRYPESLKGQPIRSYVVQAKTVSAGAASALTDFRPVVEQLPIAGGADGKRKKYLFIFHNDGEERPDGGFMTAYAIVYVENGKVTLDKSDDIYELDKKFKKNLPIPEKLGKYLTTEKRWNLRDMNINPDFRESINTFMTYYRDLPGESKDIDGVVGINTKVLTDALRVLGPIDVPTFGKFTAENDKRCDCPQIIYALSEIADRPTPFVRPDRKGVLGPLARTLLDKAYGAPKTQWPQLFETAWKNIEARNVQLFFYDPKLQAAAESINAAGRMKPDPKVQDFLAIVDANLGGAKSNFFITSDVRQEVSAPANGVITKKLTLTYKNSRKGDNCNLEAGQLCLNARLRDWQRLYLPKGSKLTSSQGYRAESVKQYDEDEFTIIEGEFLLDPLSQTKLQVEYTVPYTDKDYKIKLWKQAGVEVVPIVFSVNGDEQEVQLDKDQVFQSKF